MITDKEIMRARRILMMAADEIAVERGKDYDNDSVGIDKYFLGVAGHLQMIHLKKLRFEAQALQVDRFIETYKAAQQTGDVCDLEAIIDKAADSMIDLINYGCFGFAKLMEAAMWLRADRNVVNEERDSAGRFSEGFDAVLVRLQRLSNARDAEMMERHQAAPTEPTDDEDAAVLDMMSEHQTKLDKKSRKKKGGKR